MQSIDAKLIPINKKLEKMNFDRTSLKNSLNDHVSSWLLCQKVT